MLPNVGGEPVDPTRDSPGLGAMSLCQTAITQLAFEHAIVT